MQWKQMNIIAFLYSNFTFSFVAEMGRFVNGEKNTVFYHLILEFFVSSVLRMRVVKWSMAWQ